MNQAELDAMKQLLLCFDITPERIAELDELKLVKMAHFVVEWNKSEVPKPKPRLGTQASIGCRTRRKSDGQKGFYCGRNISNGPHIVGMIQDDPSTISIASWWEGNEDYELHKIWELDPDA